MIVPYVVRLAIDSQKPNELREGLNPREWKEWKHDEPSDWSAVACAYARWIDDINNPKAYVVEVRQTNTDTPVVRVKVTPRKVWEYRGVYDE